jgi:hypothetical protein
MREEFVGARIAHGTTRPRSVRSRARTAGPGLRTAFARINMNSRRALDIRCITRKTKDACLFGHIFPTGRGDVVFDVHIHAEDAVFVRRGVAVATLFIEVVVVSLFVLFATGFVA